MMVTLIFKNILLLLLPLQTLSCPRSLFITTMMTETIIFIIINIIIIEEIIFLIIILFHLKNKILKKFIFIPFF